MCKDNVDLPKEANKAKCFVIACFVFSLFSIIGFFSSWAGIIGGLCGILACIGSSILMCCAPANAQQGGGKFTAAGALLLIAGIIQTIMSVAVLGLMVALINEVHKGWCDDYYKKCDTDDSGKSCSDKSGANGWGYDTTSDSVCQRYSPDSSSDYTCSAQANWDNCESLHGGAKDAVTGIIVVIFGISIAFLLIAGILNIIGGAYCVKAKKAIAAMQANGPPAASAVAVPAVAGTVAVPSAVAVPTPAAKV
jgi:hypothetical protein